MKKNLTRPFRGLILLTIGLWLSVSLIAQSGPTATELAANMKIGWNIGNSLEVPGSETAWGNPATTQTLINAVKSAGFNTVRIPCAWDSYADQSTFEISSTWLARVKEVVDYCVNNDMYVILNIHWDGGWLEDNPTYSMQTSVNAKQEAYWTQIASYFIGYDEHLLFAGTNEVHADYGTPTTENIEVQESYNQTFVDAVRATGGNNAYRNLVVQTYNTNMWHGLDYFTMPNDVVSNRLIVECHYYDPYDFTLNTDNNSACYTWGTGSSDVCSWGQEDYADDLLGRIKSKFVNNGIPVIIGEYAVVKRTSLSGTAYTDHIASRNYYLEYITAAAIENGIIPIYWDNGYNGDMGLALFDRNSGSIVDQEALSALMKGANVDPGTTTYTLTTSTNGSGSISPSSGTYTYNAGSSVTLTATPSNGYQFDGWSGSISGTTNPVTLTMNSNYSVTANFSVIPTGGTTITIQEDETGFCSVEGTIETDNTGYTGTGYANTTNATGMGIDYKVNVGTAGAYTITIRYAATNDRPAKLIQNGTTVASNISLPSSGEWTTYSSVSTTANLSAGLSDLRLEATTTSGLPNVDYISITGSDISVANCGTTIIYFTLTTNVSGQGTISPSNGSYEAGTSVTITATPSSGYQFSGWSGALSGTTNPATLTMNADYTVTANFTSTQTTTYSLTTSTSGSGSISLNPTGGVYNAGDIVTVNASPNSGYQFDGWGGALSGTTNPTTITMNDNYSISATFSEIPEVDCDNPTAISLSFTKEGAGEYCWVTSDDISYASSWGLNKLTINNVDYTNVWSNSIPAKIDGAYYIYYNGSNGWSHFEAVSTKSAPLTDNTSNAVTIYPNPFSESVNIIIDNPELVNRIVILDQLGRQINTIDKSDISVMMDVGQTLSSGIYFLQIYEANSVRNFTLNKN